jgi:hypothetical protein
MMVDVAFHAVAGVYGNAKVAAPSAESDEAPIAPVGVTVTMLFVALPIPDTVSADDDAVPNELYVDEAYGVATDVPPAVTSDVPSKYTEFPVVVNDDALVPPRLIASVPVVSEMAIPSDDVANWIQVLPGPPMRSDDEAMVERPVPPFPPGSVPVTSAARLMSEVPTTPAVALRKPESAPIESVFETLRFEVEANEEMVRSDVVAFDAVRFVVVPVETERFAIDDEARMLIPRVVVGVSAPETIDQSLMRSAVVVERRLLNDDQSADARQPKVDADAVSQVTFPAA